MLVECDIMAPTDIAFSSHKNETHSRPFSDNSILIFLMRLLKCRMAGLDVALLCLLMILFYVQGPQEFLFALAIIFTLNYAVTKEFSRIQVFSDTLKVIQCINGSID